MLFDKAKIIVKAGAGGNGIGKFDRSRNPVGGDGGVGGSVFLVGSEHVYDLRNIKSKRDYNAGDGSAGGRNGQTGEKGRDLRVTVPIGTHLLDDLGNTVLAVTEHNQEVKVAAGGSGGLGNKHFKGWQVERFANERLGKPGEQKELNLQLKLVADVIFIGYPNAGKSSMLNELTNAKAKVASYAFTTLDPQLGDAQGIRLLDLPGLIEGTFEGKGLGTRFLKHTESARLVAHFVSCENDNILASYTSMRRELENIDKRLTKLPEVIVLSKSDEVSSEVLGIKNTELRKLSGNEVVAVSVLDDTSIEKLHNKLRELLA